jgi:hypothetical protein
VNAETTWYGYTAVNAETTPATKASQSRHCATLALDCCTRRSKIESPRGYSNADRNGNKIPNIGIGASGKNRVGTCCFPGWSAYTLTNGGILMKTSCDATSRPNLDPQKSVRDQSTRILHNSDGAVSCPGSGRGKSFGEVERVGTTRQAVCDLNLLETMVCRRLPTQRIRLGNWF